MSINYNNTLYILDWDNTLFPTTDAINVDDFTKLDNTIYLLLTLLIKRGKVIIVTNAIELWVKQSKKLLPKTSIIVDKIKIISARTTYKNKSSNMMDWKKYAFKDIVHNEYNKSQIINIISIGDALYEQNALAMLNFTFKNKIRYLKTIKFIDYPNINQLINQLRILIKNIQFITNTKHHIHKVFKIIK